jgi:hypothetical protein
MGALGRFVSGNSGGPGRPKGSRNRLGEEFLSDLYADWTEHGASVIAEVRERNPVAYLRTVAGLLPRQVGITTVREDVRAMTDEELARAPLSAHETLRLARFRARRTGSPCCWSWNESAIEGGRASLCLRTAFVPGRARMNKAHSPYVNSIGGGALEDAIEVTREMLDAGRDPISSRWHDFIGPNGFRLWDEVFLHKPLLSLDRRRRRRES